MKLGFWFKINIAQTKGLKAFLLLLLLLLFYYIYTLGKL
jgi:hypothetical protein